MPVIPGIVGITDVFHSPNVYANNVEIALWQQHADTAAFLSGLTAPDLSYALEQGDADDASSSSVTGIQGIINQGISNGTISSTSTALTSTTVGPIDNSTGSNNAATVTKLDWSQFNENNIPYDTLMLTPNTSLATFTTKAALWNNQPTPMNVNSQYVTGVSRGDNKHIKAQYGLTVPQILHNLSNLASNAYEPIKAQFPNVVVTNTFRQGPPGGAHEQKQHGTGQAMDLVFPGVSRAKHFEIAKWIRDNIPFDQLLQEKSGNTIWIHVSVFSGYGSKVETSNRVANMIVSPTTQFIPGLAILT
jgi:hypothetical protein